MPASKNGSEWSRPERSGTTNAMSGSVAGHSVQAGAVHGGIHFHTDRGELRPSVPRQLLPPPTDFTGRVAELTQLDQLITASQRDEVPALVVLTGPGGVGKTALALQWAHNGRDRFPDGQLYIDLAGFRSPDDPVDPVDPGEALGQFIRALGVPPEQVPATLAEQAALFRSLTARKSLVVLLDNVYSTAQARVLLPASDRAVVLVTSRSRLVGLVSDGARLLPVAPLDETTAIKLLTRTIGIERVSDELDRATDLVNLCGGLPIAVRLAAARLAARPRWSLGRALTELTDERTRLTALSTTGDTSLQALFDLSYQQLSEQATMLYRRLGLHPGREFDSMVCSAVLECELAEAEDVLYELVESNLVEEIAEDRFRFHDLLRLHARQRAMLDEAPAQRERTLRQILEWYLAAAMAADRVLTPYRRRLSYEFSVRPTGTPTFADREQALAWLETERENLLVAGQVSLTQQWFDLGWQLSDVMWPLLLYRKHYRDRVAIDERGVMAAREWGNAVAEADMLKRLGLGLRTLGRYEEAALQLQASLDRWSQLGDRTGCAEAQEALGLLHLSSDRAAEAVEQFGGVLTLYRELDNKRGTGLALINLALGLHRLGQPELALRHIHEARAIFDQIADVDPYNGARALVVQAQLHCATGNVTAAQELATAGLDAMRRLGSQFGEAEAHEVLAEVELRRGDLDAARTHLDKAMTTFTALRSPRAAALRSRLWSRVHQDAS
jgi:tetratricopeptide (TPR) repeat protein